MQRVPVDSRRVKPDNAPVTVGRTIKRLREAAGVSQEALGAALGIDQTGVGKIESGQRALTVERLLRIEDALGLDRGAIVLDAGLVPGAGTVEAAVLSDRGLTPVMRRSLLVFYRSAVKEAAS